MSVWVSDVCSSYLHHAGPTWPTYRYFGSGNALLLRSRCILTDEPFDPRMTRTGGEDTILFERLKRDGRTFAWCAEAPVLEHVDGSRVTLAYLAKRSFRRGQSPTIACAMVRQIGRAHVSTPVTNAQLVYRLLIANKKN